MIDISTAGSGITIFTLRSFPMGFRLSAFADDADALDVEQTEVTGFERLYDGTIFSYDKNSPVLLSVGIIPNTDDDINLKILLQSRKPAKATIPIADDVTMVIGYADGGRNVLSNGVILGGAMADSLLASGRKKSNVYHFAFGAFDGFQSRRQVFGNVFNAALLLARGGA